MQAATSTPAEAYERHFVPAMFRPWSRLLLEQAKLAPGARVLDVACGTGVVAREAAQAVGQAGEVTGLDLSAPMLAVAKVNDPTGRIRWVEGSAQALPFDDGRFDAVLCQHGLQFFPDRVGALREMRRVLAPGGRTLVMVLREIDKHPVFEAVMDSVARELGLPLAQVALPFAIPEREALADLLAQAGYAAVAVRAVSTEVRFDDAVRFVPLVVTSSAAAVPAFAQLAGEGREALVDRVRAAVAPTVAAHTRDGQVVFTMQAHVGSGSSVAPADRDGPRPV